MRRRLLVSTVGIAVVVTVLLGVPMAALTDRLAYETARIQLERQAVSVGLALEPALVTGRVPTPALLERIVADGERITVLTPAGSRITAGEVEGSAIAITAPGPAGTRIELATSDDAVRDEVRSSWSALAGLAMLGVAAAVALALLQARRLGKPLQALRRQAQRIGFGDFTAAAPRSGLVEVDAIATALDETSGHLAALVAAERSFSANASHQLRTALTGLTLRLDMLADHDDARVREESLAAIGQAERLKDTIEDLLTLARTGRVGERRPVDLRALVDEHVEDWRDRFRTAGRTITVEGASPVPVQVAPGGIGEAIDVLIDNARTHGDGPVTVQVHIVDDRAELDVVDTGPGVDDDAVVFQRRLSPDGHGLGLSLARDLVEADGGALELVERHPPRFRIRLAAGPDRR